MTDDLQIPYAHGEVAAQDWGGDGPDLLLTHGANSNLMSMRVLRRHLRGFRIVAVDLPSHGRSSVVDPWTSETSVDALEAVAAHLGLDQPAVVGHSLGGMVAATYGIRHPEAPGVVNLDGHGNGTADDYDGADPADVAAFLAAAADRDPEPDEGDRAWVDARIAALAAPLGGDPEVIRPFVEREFHAVGPGRFRHLPPPSLTADIRADLERAPLYERYRACEAPLLIYNCTRPGGDGGGIENFAEMSAAYRRGLARNLAAIAAEKPNVEIETVDATHLLTFEIPDRIGDRVREFLGVT